MLCKKCGANIEDASKFCGYCGKPVEQITSEIQTVIDTQFNGSQEENNNSNIINEIDLGKTIKIEPVNAINETATEPVSDTQVPPIGPGLPGYVEPQVSETITPVIANNQTIPNTMNSEVSGQIPVNGPVMSNTPKKNNKLLFIIGGIVLAVVAIILVVLAFMNSSNNSISVLKKTLANLEEKGENNATVDAKISFSTATGESFSFSATAKAEKKSDDEMNVEIVVNKSLFFEEMNLYASLTEEDLTMYMESTLIDMLGLTYSETPTWVYYTMDLDELVEEENVEEIDLEEIIDRKHFVFVDETNVMKHYQLIIDQELINRVKTKLETVNNEELKDMVNSTETLEKPIKIDFYITNQNELSKIELDMSEYLEDTEDIASFVMSIELKDLGNTKVEIPMDAKNSIVDMETYTSSNAVTDFDTGLEYEDTYTYDNNSFDASLNGTVYGF